MFEEIYQFALSSGASNDRAENYQSRAAAAFKALSAILNTLLSERQKIANDDSDINIRFSCDDKEIQSTVVYYYRQVIHQKEIHGKSADERLETPQCAGLWYSAIIDEPPFYIETEKTEDLLSDKEIMFVEETQVCLGFYMALKTVCAHSQLIEMQHRFKEIIRITIPIRNYMFDHRYDLTLAGITGMFYTLYCSCGLGRNEKLQTES